MRIHCKQITVLALAAILAIASFWIPLPAKLQPAPPTDITQIVSPKPMAFSQEPAVATRFSATTENPQVALYVTGAVVWPDNKNLQFIRRLIELKEFSDNKQDELNLSRFAPIADQNRYLGR